MAHMSRGCGSEVSLQKRIMELFPALEAYYEFDSGWPGGGWPVSGRFNPARFEVIVGAVLTQNTRWENVEMALGVMVEQGLTSAGDIAHSKINAVETAVRSSGFFRQKASTLIEICRLWESTMGIPPADITREELLGITRIGPETADSVLLFALHRPEFIADTYTRRLVSRLGFFSSPPDYQSVKTLFEKYLPNEVPLFQKLHALIVQHAKKFCRRNPVCEGCPFQISNPHFSQPCEARR